MIEKKGQGNLAHCNKLSDEACQLLGGWGANSSQDSNSQSLWSPETPIPSLSTLGPYRNLRYQTPYAPPPPTPPPKKKKLVIFLPKPVSPPTLLCCDNNSFHLLDTCCVPGMVLKGLPTTSQESSPRPHTQGIVVSILILQVKKQGGHTARRWWRRDSSAHSGQNAGSEHLTIASASFLSWLVTPLCTNHYFSRNTGHSSGLLPPCLPQL